MWSLISIILFSKITNSSFADCISHYSSVKKCGNLTVWNLTYFQNESSLCLQKNGTEMHYLFQGEKQFLESTFTMEGEMICKTGSRHETFFASSQHTVIFPDACHPSSFFRALNKSEQGRMKFASNEYFEWVVLAIVFSELRLHSCGSRKKDSFGCNWTLLSKKPSLLWQNICFYSKRVPCVTYTVNSVTQCAAWMRARSSFASAFGR